MPGAQDLDVGPSVSGDDSLLADEKAMARTDHQRIVDVAMGHGACTATCGAGRLRRRRRREFWQ